MNKYLLIAGIVVIVGIGLYVVMTGSPAEAPGTPGEPEEEEQVAEEEREIVVNIQEQNESGMSGTAVLTEMDSGVNIVLDLSSAPEDVIQPAHMHSNSCQDIGGVVYPLTFPVDGYSETLLDVSLDEILDGLPLAVNVHKSAEEADVYVACGDIETL